MGAGSDYVQRCNLWFFLAPSHRVKKRVKSFWESLRINKNRFNLMFKGDFKILYKIKTLIRRVFSVCILMDRESLHDYMRWPSCIDGRAMPQLG